MPFARPVEDKLGADQQPAFWCCIWRLTRIRWMSMFIPPSTKCVFINPGWCTTFIYQGVLSVLQQQTETTLPLEEIAPAPRHVPGKTVSPPGGNHFAVPAEPTAAREPATPRYSCGASGGNGGRQSAGGWPHAQPGLSEAAGRGLSRAFTDAGDEAPRRSRLRLRLTDIARVSVAY
ncbi:DNA mismatch repair protein MutL [Salmonella enterica subsp. enterica]|uniref:DNA mismatch repair protein MutL n=1 Tax=Salmonella enterica I TaxID=59201 RepID=A0A447TPA1_SALET|nr:DNA mismatch repair protein MutL [Salmonella enterica subsp. enterica]